MDLSVGKYKAVKMAFVNLANERDMYLNFNTESTALCLESLGTIIIQIKSFAFLQIFRKLVIGIFTYKVKIFYNFGNKLWFAEL